MGVGPETLIKLLNRERMEIEMTRSGFHVWWYRSKRWLYAGQHPNWIARTLNKAYAIVASSGVTSNYMVTLEVTGRKSGWAVSLPVAVAVVEGERYLVSMLGEHVNWVQNVRAAGGRATLHSGGREEVHLEEVAASQRAPILKAYLQRAPGARPHVPVNKDAPLAEFEQVAPAFPVFRVVSTVPAQPHKPREQSYYPHHGVRVRPNRR
jgi:deazaflavin-dependent oxidoreductase (nitroreductase family)